MSSANQDMVGSCGFVREGRVNKTNKTRRTWSTREEGVLLVALKELVAQGWKSDNGFRAGYLKKLEDAMKKDFPTTDLKGMPHINSKVTTWKKTYNSICDMLKVSGVGFNKDETHMVDCTNEQWSEILALDKNAGNMRYKGWPYFDDWGVIFGKDRATGEESVDPMEAAHQMYRNIDLSQEKVDGDYHVSLDDIFDTVDVDDSASNSHKPVEEERSTGKKRKKDVDDSVSQTHKLVEEERSTGKKRKKDVSLPLMLETVTEVTREASQRLGTIAGRMGYDFDISKARKEVFAQLGAIPGLTLKEKFEVTDLLAKEVERLDVFSSLPEDARAAYVEYLLQLKSKEN